MASDENPYGLRICPPHDYVHLCYQGKYLTVVPVRKQLKLLPPVNLNSGDEEDVAELMKRLFIRTQVEDGEGVHLRSFIEPEHFIGIQQDKKGKTEVAMVSGRFFHTALSIEGGRISCIDSPELGIAVTKSGRLEWQALADATEFQIIEPEGARDALADQANQDPLSSKALEIYRNANLFYNPRDFPTEKLFWTVKEHQEQKARQQGADGDVNTFQKNKCEDRADEHEGEHLTMRAADFPFFETGELKVPQDQLNDRGKFRMMDPDVEEDTEPLMSLASKFVLSCSDEQGCKIQVTKGSDVGDEKSASVGDVEDLEFDEKEFEWNVNKREGIGGGLTKVCEFHKGKAHDSAKTEKWILEDIFDPANQAAMSKHHKQRNNLHLKIEASIKDIEATATKFTGLVAARKDLSGDDREQSLIDCRKLEKDLQAQRIRVFGQYKKIHTHLRQATIYHQTIENASPGTEKWKTRELDEISKRDDCHNDIKKIADWKRRMEVFMEDNAERLRDCQRQYAMEREKIQTQRGILTHLMQFAREGLAHLNIMESINENSSVHVARTEQDNRKVFEEQLQMLADAVTPRETLAEFHEEGALLCRAGQDYQRQAYDFLVRKCRQQIDAGLMDAETRELAMAASYQESYNEVVKGMDKAGSIKRRTSYRSHEKKLISLKQKIAREEAELNFDEVEELEEEMKTVEKKYNTQKKRYDDLAKVKLNLDKDWKTSMEDVYARLAKRGHQLYARTAEEIALKPNYNRAIQLTIQAKQEQASG